jgi:hypothetical protein
MKIALLTIGAACGAIFLSEKGEPLTIAKGALAGGVVAIILLTFIASVIDAGWHIN